MLNRASQRRVERSGVATQGPARRSHFFLDDGHAVVFIAGVEELIPIAKVNLDTQRA